MRHVSDIKRLISLLLQSERFHVLLVQGAPGWAKTHTTREALAELGVPYQLLGSYSTPLALFNKLAEDPGQVMVIDDTASIFYNSLSLSILNSASWPSAGNGGKRHVRWTSTSERAAAEWVDFEGKLIILTNLLPQSPQAQALANRALTYVIEINAGVVGDLLDEAATSVEHFPDTALARNVAAFLAEQARFFDPGKISLRTLEQGYDLARVDPDGWRDLLLRLLPKAQSTNPSAEDMIRQLGSSGLKIEEQASRFCQATGKSRRTFFYLRSKIGVKQSETQANATAKSEASLIAVSAPSDVPATMRANITYERIDQ